MSNLVLVQGADVESNNPTLKAQFATSTTLKGLYEAKYGVVDAATLKLPMTETVIDRINELLLAEHAEKAEVLKETLLRNYVDLKSAGRILQIGNLVVNSAEAIPHVRAEYNTVVVEVSAIQKDSFVEIWDHDANKAKVQVHGADHGAYVKISAIVDSKSGLEPDWAKLWMTDEGVSFSKKRLQYIKPFFDAGVRLFKFKVEAQPIATATKRYSTFKVLCDSVGAGTSLQAAELAQLKELWNENVVEVGEPVNGVKSGTLVIKHYPTTLSHSLEYRNAMVVAKEDIGQVSSVITGMKNAKAKALAAAQAKAATVAPALKSEEEIAVMKQESQLANEDKVALMTTTIAALTASGMSVNDAAALAITMVAK
jgi:hypothetical protein